jgi:hypothetical protein
MNCKPGDLAVIVAGRPRRNVGRIVRCVEVVVGETCSCGGAVWIIDGDTVPVGSLAGLFSELLGIKPMVGDCCLKPIRDPGDDAVDEVLQRVGAPARLVGMPEEA